MGVHWENEGLPRIAGRIFGFLLVRENAASLDELATALGVSKASVSTDARRLETVGLIVRTARPGDRRDYYEVAPDVPARILELKLESVRRHCAVIQDLVGAVQLAPSVQARFDGFLRSHHRIVAQLETLLTELRTPEPLRPTTSRSIA